MMSIFNVINVEHLKTLMLKLLLTIFQYLEWNDCMHAVGQGSLGIECAENNEFILDILNSLNDPTSYLLCLAERSLMRTLEGGCSVPVAVCSRLTHPGPSGDNNVLLLKGSVWNLDGSKFVMEELESNLLPQPHGVQEGNKSVSNPDLTSVYFRQFINFTPNAAKLSAQLGQMLGQRLLAKGAKEILEEVKAEKAR